MPWQNAISNVHIVFAAFIVLKYRSNVPIHKLSIRDVHVRAGNARVCVMPTFLWRQEPCGSETGCPVTQLHVLRAWANIIVELYTRDTEVSRWPLAQIQDWLLHQSTLPPDAVQLLSTCLNEV